MIMSWRCFARPASSSSPYSSQTWRTHSYRLYCRKVDDVRWTFWCVRGTSNVNENCNYQTSGGGERVQCRQAAVGSMSQTIGSCHTQHGDPHLNTNSESRSRRHAEFWTGIQFRPREVEEEGQIQLSIVTRCPFPCLSLGS
jgi:hypothetical protein